MPSDRLKVLPVLTNHFLLLQIQTYHFIHEASSNRLRSHLSNVTFVLLVDIHHQHHSH